MSTYRRHRLTRPQLARCFGTDAPPDNVFHFASEELGTPTIFRAVFASSVDSRQIERIKKHVGEAKRNPSIRPWLEAGDYGFAVLVPWREKVDAMRKLIHESSLSKDTPFVVDLGPTTETLHQVHFGK
jgi:hypothetical protein